MRPPSASRLLRFETANPHPRPLPAGRGEKGFAFAIFLFGFDSFWERGVGESRETAYNLTVILPCDAGNSRKSARNFYFLSYLTPHSWPYRGGLRWLIAILEAFRRKDKKALESHHDFLILIGVDSFWERAGEVESRETAYNLAVILPYGAGNSRKSARKIYFLSYLCAWSLIAEALRWHYAIFEAFR